VVLMSVPCDSVALIESPENFEDSYIHFLFNDYDDPATILMPNLETKTAQDV